MSVWENKLLSDLSDDSLRLPIGKWLQMFLMSKYYTFKFLMGKYYSFKYGIYIEKFQQNNSYRQIPIAI